METNVEHTSNATLAVPMILKSAEAHISDPLLIIKFAGGAERKTENSSYSINNL